MAFPFYLEQAKSVQDIGRQVEDHRFSKPNLSIRLQPASRTTDSYIHLTMYDITIYPVVEVAVGEARIASGLVKHWGMTEQEVWRTAFEHLPSPVLMSMGEMLGNLLDDAADVPSDLLEMKQSLSEDETPFYILSLGRPDVSGFHAGAAVLLYPEALKMMLPKLETDGMWILPSSTQEVLVLPEDYVQSEDDLYAFEEILCSVNRTEVSPDEFLSDTVYHYCGANDVLEPARKYLEKKLAS